MSLFIIKQIVQMWFFKIFGVSNGNIRSGHLKSGSRHQGEKYLIQKVGAIIEFDYLHTVELRTVEICSLCYALPQSDWSCQAVHPSGN